MSIDGKRQCNLTISILKDRQAHDKQAFSLSCSNIEGIKRRTINASSVFANVSSFKWQRNETNNIKVLYPNGKQKKKEKASSMNHGVI